MKNKQAKQMIIDVFRQQIPVPLEFVEYIYFRKYGISWGYCCGGVEAYPVKRFGTVSIIGRVK